MNTAVIGKELLGKVCCRAWDGLLPAIFLELGTGSDTKIGEYSICFDTCPWQIFEQDIEIVNSKQSKEVIDKILPRFVGQELTDFEFNQQDSVVMVTFGKLKIIGHLNDVSDTCYILKENHPGGWIFRRK